MDPRLYLRLARDLAAQGGVEHRRTAISRSYYAVNNVAVDLLRNAGARIDPGHAAHEIVRTHLRSTRVDSLIHVAAQLYRFQLLRVKADYWMRDPEPELPDTASEWVARAEEMIRDLDATAADPRAIERLRRSLQP
jgi:hypothetical protein